MIFHDVHKAAKGILKDFAAVPEGDDDKPVEKRLRISTTPRKVDDFHEGVREREAGETDPHNGNAIRLSPLSLGGGAREASGTGKLGILVILIIGISLSLIALLSYSAWNAAGTEAAYARDGLTRIAQDFGQVRTLYEAGRIKEAGEAFSEASSRMEDFTQNLRMRLLLPQVRSSGTDTELPSTTLDFVSHTLSAIREYSKLYQRASNLVTVGQEGSQGDLVEMERIFNAGTTELLEAQEILTSIRGDTMPQDLRVQLEEVRSIFSEASRIAQTLRSEMPTIFDALGGSYPRRYAILLQNADEMRPTGGFIGGVLFIDVNEGRITKSEYFDVYELDWRLPSAQTPPTDLAGISGEYGLRDSNRFPDFPRSAREALAFFDKQGIPTVDGVIAINHRLLEEILSATGPVKSSAVPMELTGVNASQILSLIVESKRNPEKPKTIIKELVPAILERASEQPIAILRVLLDGIRHGDVAFYSIHSAVQNAIERSGLAGMPRTPLPSQDYLSITQSNFGGNKSDRYVTEQVTHVTTITDQGARDTLRIVRQHGFGKEAALSITSLASMLGITPVSDTLMSIMGRGQNKTVVRVAVPKGSLLRETTGIPLDIVTTTEEEGKTIFSFPMNVMPGNVVDATLTYTLPSSITKDGSYELLVDKQIGQKTVSYDKRLEFAENVNIDGAPTKEYGKRIDLDRSQTFVVEWK